MKFRTAEAEALVQSSGIMDAISAADVPAALGVDLQSPLDITTTLELGLQNPLGCRQNQVLISESEE
jgi:hypothetical protein